MAGFALRSSYMLRIEKSLKYFSPNAPGAIISTCWVNSPYYDFIELP